MRKKGKQNKLPKEYWEKGKSKFLYWRLVELFGLNGAKNKTINDIRIIK
jgi:hypothetical protein